MPESGTETSGAKPRPASWLKLFFVYSGLTALALVAGILLVDFVQHRPLNLVAPTDRLYGHFKKALADCYAVVEGEDAPELVAESGRKWHLYRLRVSVPTHLDAVGVYALVRDHMLEYDALLENTMDQDGLPGWRLNLGELPVAEVLLAGSIKVPGLRRDMRDEARQAAADVRKAFVAAGLLPGNLTVGPTESQQTENAEWLLTPMAASLSARVSIGELRGRLEEQLAAYGYTVATDYVQGAPTLHIGRDAYIFVDMVCTQAVPQSVTPTQEAIAPGAEAVETPAATAPEAHELPLDSIELEPSTDGQPVPPSKRVHEVEMPQAAIILDDGGYGGALTEEVLALDKHLTLAILPATPHGEETARAAVGLGFEVMLHMPMETHSKTVKHYPGQLSTGMEAAEIQRLTKDALRQVPGAVGINNHTGSRFTSDPVGMQSFLAVVKEESVYFVDSLTRASSVAYAMAQKLGVPSAERDLFLDHENGEDTIRKRVDQLMALAKSHGKALAIGHFRPATVSVLKEKLPEFAEQGIQLIHVSEYIQ